MTLGDDELIIDALDELAGGYTSRHQDSEKPIKLLPLGQSKSSSVRCLSRMAPGSALAWDTQGKLNAIDEDEYPDDVEALLDSAEN